MEARLKAEPADAYGIFLESQNAAGSRGGMRVNSKILSREALSRIIGIERVVPMTPLEMARSLRVAFFPSTSSSEKLSQFLSQLKEALLIAGAEVLSYDQALAEGANGRIAEGIVLIAVGEGESGNMAIDHVSSLINNTVVGVFDGTLPNINGGLLQRRLDVVVGALVWNMVHIVVYVDELSWTVCTMNGGIDTFGLESLRNQVLDSFIPKIAAPVIPPQKEDFDICEKAFDPSEPKYALSIKDLLIGSEIWGRSGLLASQTKLESLTFRNLRYRRIAAAFLNERTGMSYGFLARQLPVQVTRAMSLDVADSMLRRLDWEEKDFIYIEGNMLAAPKLGNQRFVVRIPEVSVLCTRSGCEKIRLDPEQDLVILTLARGKVQLGTPRGLAEGSDCQPSFDTLTILSHAVGNAILASILCSIRQDSRFVRSLTHSGLAMAHWHGYPDFHSLPNGYYLHGEANPPVSCSTDQAAIFALSGKLGALKSSIELGIEFIGDAHVELSHGTNLTGRSLPELAKLARGGNELGPALPLRDCNE